MLMIDIQIDVDTFFLMLEKQAGIYKISQFKVSPWENIFDYVSIAHLKKMGISVLRKVR